MARPALATRRTDRRFRRQLTALELAKKLLKMGANPNVRIPWQDKKFDKEGGTMKNPPLIQLGRHYLTLYWRDTVLRCRA